MSDDLCIICGETEDGTPSAEAAHFQMPTHVHEFLPMSKLTAEFLAELHRRASAYGWSGDFEEIHRFVEQQYSVAGIEMPKLEPTAAAALSGIPIGDTTVTVSTNGRPPKPAPPFET